MKHLFIIGLVCLFVMVAGAQEIQIPFDLAGTITDLDRELEQQLNIFPEYKTFQYARLFQLMDSTFVLEIYYLPKQTLTKDRIPLSVESLTELRSRVTETLHAQRSQVLNQEGRTKFLAGTMTLALGYYGWAVPFSLQVNNGKLALAMYMLTSGAGFYIPYSATQNYPVSDAAATFGLYGATRGILHGWMLANLITNAPSDEGGVATGMLTSVAETVYGFKRAITSRMTAGTAETIGTCGDFGIGLGAGMAHLAGFFNDDNSQAAAGTLLLGTGIGFASGHWLARQQDYTRGDAFVLSASGLLGAYFPLFLVDMIKPDNEKAYTLASVIGGVTGLGMGNLLVQGRDFSTAQGNYIRLSEIAGGLLGLGLAYLISSEENDNSTLYLTSSAAGATTGFWLMYRANARKAFVSRKGFSMNLQVMPQALVTGRVCGGHKPMPFLNLSMQF